jgi:dipeptidyl aminopeptidase/acylaminoacyl peptidase
MFRVMYNLLRRLILLLALVLAGPAVVAASAAPTVPPIDHFFRDPEIGIARLSPNGRYLATTARKLGTLQLTVIDLETREAKALAGYDDLDIHTIGWVGNDRLIFNVIDRSSEQNSSYSGLYSVARDGGKITVLIDTARELRLRSYAEYTSTPLHMEFKGVTHDGSGNVLAVGYFSDGDALPYLINAATGRRKEIQFDVPGLPRRFLFDQRDQLRVVVTHSAKDGKHESIWYRDDTATAWRKLSEHASFNAPFDVVAIAAGDLYVSAPAGTKWGIHKYDLVNNKVGTLMASDQHVDIDGDLVIDPGTDQVLGVRVMSEPPRTHWLDERMAALQAGIDRINHGLVNQIMPGDAHAPLLVYSYSSTYPGRYARYDPATKKLEALIERMPWINAAQMSEQLVFDYQARDGLPIMSYLTLPVELAAKALPLIVLPHGGPSARDYWGFSAEVQFLASRGYAVLQPQFRGSTGFGPMHFQKGFRQWGLAMQDDLTDGVTNLVRQGVVDPARVCIMGASYGGYAAMMGVVREPSSYKCAINLLGVTDLQYLLTKGRWEENAAAIFSIKTMIADPDTMRDQIVSTSPVKQAAKIQSPVFLAYGGKDNRVPIEHGTDMRDALQAAGKVYEWMPFWDEEHGFAKEANRIKVYTAIDNFLRKYNPAGQAP